MESNSHKTLHVWSGIYWKKIIVKVSAFSKKSRIHRRNGEGREIIWFSTTFFLWVLAQDILVSMMTNREDQGTLKFFSKWWNLISSIGSRESPQKWEFEDDLGTFKRHFRKNEKLFNYTIRPNVSQIGLMLLKIYWELYNQGYSLFIRAYIWSKAIGMSHVFWDYLSVNTRLYTRCYHKWAEWLKNPDSEVSLEASIGWLGPYLQLLTPTHSLNFLPKGYLEAS